MKTEKEVGGNPYRSEYFDILLQELKEEEDEDIEKATAAYLRHHKMIDLSCPPRIREYLNRFG